MPLKRYSAVLALVAALFSSSFAQSQSQPTVLVDVDHRPAMSLNGEWHFIADPYRNGWGDNPDKASPKGFARNWHIQSPSELVEYDFSKSPTLHVPGDWNSQRPELFLYEGLLWYEKDFEYHARKGTHVFLHFGAANHRAHVFVNGTHVCDHEGGFTPFDCESTDALKDGANFVVVAVDDERRADTIPALKSDWWNYGGLTRDVSVVEVPATFVDDYSLQLKRGAGDVIEGYAHVVGAKAGSEVALHIADLKVDRTAQIDAQGRAAFSFEATGLERWSPGHPRLYRVDISAGEDRLHDDVGFRTIEVKGDHILLNGKPVFLRGVCAHAEAPYRSGRAATDQDAQTLLGWAKELDANFIRLAHYPHDERMTRLADKMGLMVWSEVPVYWSIDWTNPRTLESAKQQLRENIRRDHNKASVILWSVSNETPRTPERLTFLRAMVAEARAQDATRLVTSAMLTPMHDKVATLNDPLGEDLDVLGYNEYIGWYTGTAKDAPQFKWENPLGKPLIMSEWGGDAKAGLHGDAGTRFTEEFQDEIYKNQIAMLKQIPSLAGTTPWVLMDFRSPARQLPGVQDYYNRKGLFSDQGVKKKAFTTLRDYYRSLPQ